MKKKVLVTGATSGVGLATAKLLHAQGYLVVGTSSNLNRAPKTEFSLVQMDLAQAEEIRSGLKKALEIFGETPDCILFNAGIGEVGAVEETPLSKMRHMFEVNYFGHVDLLKRLLPEMRKRGSGSLIFMGSLVFSLQFPFKATYCASKSALSAFALSLRHELLPFGIRTHLIEPGWIRSDFHGRLHPPKITNSPYTKDLGFFLDHSKDKDPRVPDGAALAKIILNCMEKSGSPFRIIVGRDALLARLLLRILPARLADWMLRKKISAKTAC